MVVELSKHIINTKTEDKRQLFKLCTICCYGNEIVISKQGFTMPWYSNYIKTIILYMDIFLKMELLEFCLIFVRV